MQAVIIRLFTFFGLLALLAWLPVAVVAADGDDLSGYPKNLARLHLGANLYQFDSGSGTYEPAKAAASWMDDDETTGWAPQAGGEYYLLVLAKPSLVRSLTLSSDGLDGSLTVYAGDERATPDSSTWTPVLRDVSIAELNEKAPSGALNRYGRYLLIETDFAEAGPLWSLYVFGREAASDYDLERRAMAVDSSTVFGQRIKQNTVIDLANLYSDASVVYVDGGGERVDWQAMIDESPETFWIVSGSDDQVAPAFAVEINQSSPVRRVSMMADAGPGVMEFFLIGGDEADASRTMQAASGAETRRLPDFAALDLDEMVPACTLGFDGVSDREAIDIAPAEGRYLVARWRPTVSGESLKLRQLDVFGDPDYDNYQVVAAPAPIAELEDNANDKYVYDPGKNFKTLLDPIAEGPVATPGGPPIFSSPVPPLLTFNPEDPEDPTPTPTPTPQTPSPSSP